MTTRRKIDATLEELRHSPHSSPIPVPTDRDREVWLEAYREIRARRMRKAARLLASEAVDVARLGYRLGLVTDDELDDVISDALTVLDEHEVAHLLRYSGLEGSLLDRVLSAVGGSRRSGSAHDGTVAEDLDDGSEAPA